MTKKAVKVRKTDPGIYFDEGYDPDFNESTMALQILYDELSARDETLAKLKSFGVQVAGMSAKNAQDIAALKRIIRGLAKSDQINIKGVEEAEGESFVDFLDQ